LTQPQIWNILTIVGSQHRGCRQERRNGPREY
jgi:hypothetical protein